MIPGNILLDFIVEEHSWARKAKIRNLCDISQSIYAMRVILDWITCKFFLQLNRNSTIYSCWSDPDKSRFCQRKIRHQPEKLIIGCDYCPLV